MGMYTELNMAAALKKDTPKEIISLLELMAVGRGRDYAGALPEHEFFNTDRWAYMLNLGSYYFDGEVKSTIRFDDISEQYYLTIRCNFKNYTGELRGFLSWINQYLDKFPGEFLGYSRYEETEEPTLIYYGGKQ